MANTMEIRTPEGDVIEIDVDTGNIITPLSDKAAEDWAVYLIGFTEGLAEKILLSNPFKYWGIIVLLRQSAIPYF